MHDISSTFLATPKPTDHSADDTEHDFEQKALTCTIHELVGDEASDQVGAGPHHTTSSTLSPVPLGKIVSSFSAISVPHESL